MAGKKRRGADTIIGRLKPADPFELIRWLARSQPDPRKALAELVQNAIDAQARNIRITRMRERGVAMLRIVDDGEGVIPELPRAAALQYIATHIGHSRKRNLTPEQRRELMLQGKYGIGLLGFWAIGEVLEMRTKLGDGPAWLLRLHEDAPQYEIEPFRTRLDLGDCYTEVIVRNLHRPASSSLTARRMAIYLASELRGQLLAHDPRVIVHDRVARGRSQKVIEVKPERFSGERLPLPEEMAVPGFQPVRLEIYLLPVGAPEEGRIAVSCNGTIVYDQLVQFEVVDLRRMPWIEPRLTGLIEFPDFQVPPGSRRGVVPDQAALAFAEALRGIEPRLREQIRNVEEHAAAEIEADILRQIERAFRDVPRLAPEYDFFAVRTRDRTLLGAPGSAEGADREGRQEPEAAEGLGLPDGGVDEIGVGEQTELLPAGVLASLHVLPAKTRVECLGERRLRAELRDAIGTRIQRAVRIDWECPVGLGAVESCGGRVALFRAGAEPGAATVIATAEESGQVARGEASVEIVEQLGGSPSQRAGIPEPIFVDEGASAWRSRMVDGRWEVNSGHPDFHAASESSKRKVRYLTALLGKEIVLHSFPAPQLGAALERLVGVLTITERRLERG
jgi:hypothetical protein